jgi:hypothetical protein
LSPENCGVTTEAQRFEVNQALRGSSRTCIFS